MKNTTFTLWGLPKKFIDLSKFTCPYAQELDLAMEEAAVQFKN